MPEFYNDGRVIYRPGEKILTSEELRAREMPLTSSGLGWERVVKATDLCPYKPFKAEEINEPTPKINKVIEKSISDEGAGKKELTRGIFETFKGVIEGPKKLRVSFSSN